MPRHPHSIAIIGAGIGGLAAAIDLSGKGFAVTLLERNRLPGGKVREVAIPGLAIDSGASSLTMRWVFDTLFESNGTSLAQFLTLDPLPILARHRWDERGHLDLFADPKASAEAIGDFAGAKEARGYLAFSARARRSYEALEQHFVKAQRPSALGLAAKAGIPRLLATAPFATLWDALGEHFADPRLRQLFARYATYVGSSPMLAPATLMLVAHVEQMGVWQVRGGLQRLVEAMAALATRLGARILYETEVAAIGVTAGRANRLTYKDGQHLLADAIIANADTLAIGAGRLGPHAARAVPATATTRRSFSAVTWAMRRRTAGCALLRDNVFFAPDPSAEYAQLQFRGRLAASPTVHLTAPDRAASAPDGPERLLALISAPARADTQPPDAEAIRAAGRAAFGLMRRAGLAIEGEADDAEITTPADFERRFPGTGGALYGQAVHGWQATFQRPAAHTRLPGFFVAGGGTHPGAGVAMAALSGRLAAAAVQEDRL